VERLTMLVTPDGEWVFPNSDEFLARLGDATPDYDAISFAVKNLGFIKFQIIRQSIIEIELHPRNVELPALLAAQQQLLQAGIKLFRVRYFDTEWHSEISSSAERTVAPPVQNDYSRLSTQSCEGQRLCGTLHSRPERVTRRNSIHAGRWSSGGGNFSLTEIFLTRARSPGSNHILF